MIKFFVLVLCLQAAVSFVECCGNKKPGGTRKPVTDEDSYLLVCKQEPLELSIILDASTSVSDKDFETAKSFVEDYVNQFEVSSAREGVRVSVITYGRGVYTQEGFNLTTYNTKEAVLEAICNIKHSHGDQTYTDMGIAYMHQVQMASDVVRPWADRISVVITDGDSTFPLRTKAAAEAARQAGIKLFAVGVGRVKQTELLNIAGDQSRVMAVANYDKLDSIKEALSSKICTKIPKPTTTPPPKIKCGILNPADVYFAFSSADLGLEGTAKATSFISKVIHHEELVEGFRFGVISGICPDDAGFNLKAYSTVNQYDARLKQYEIGPLPRLTERLLGDAYSVDNGGRTNASRVAVIITSGTGYETDELTLQVERLKRNGIKVYIVDPNGQAVTIDDAKALIGGSSTVQAEALVTLLCPSI